MQNEKNAFLEQHLREMASALVASMVPETQLFAPLPPSAQPKSIIITAPPPHQEANLAQEFDSQLNLPTALVDIAA